MHGTVTFFFLPLFLYNTDELKAYISQLASNIYLLILKSSFVESCVYGNVSKYFNMFLPLDFTSLHALHLPLFV